MVAIKSAWETFLLLVDYDQEDGFILRSNDEDKVLSITANPTKISDASQIQKEIESLLSWSNQALVFIFFFPLLRKIIKNSPVEQKI